MKYGPRSAPPRTLVAPPGSGLGCASPCVVLDHCHVAPSMSPPVYLGRCASLFVFAFSMIVHGDEIVLSRISAYIGCGAHRALKRTAPDHVVFCPSATMEVVIKRQV